MTASLDLKETFLQFGTGNFLRAFVDLFVAEENRAGGAAGRIVAVQSTGAERARELNERDCRYHVAIRGFREGKVIDEVEEVDSISRVLMAASDWDEILKVASSPDLKWIISNVTEAGLTLEEQDLPPSTVREAVEHPEVGPWIRRLLFEEIVPVLEGGVEHPELFARQTLDRFANPFLDHNLSDIAKGHEGKVALRLLPTRQEYRERFGREPELLVSIL